MEFSQRGTKSIVLVELDLESVVVDFETSKVRISSGFSVICGVWKSKGGLDEQIISGIDRVLRAVSRTSITFVGIE